MIPVASRRRERGVALVEAVIVLPLFVALLAAMFHVSALYRAKLSAMNEARSAAWSHVLSGCRAPSRLAQRQVDAGAADAASRAGAPLPAESRGYVSVVGGAGTFRDVSATRVEVQRSLRDSPLLGLSPANVSAGVRLPCNETPQSGNLMGALRYGWTLVRFW